MSYVTVVIPTYNEEEGIKDTIQRIPEEVYGKEVTTVVVDGNSTDSTREKVRESSAKLMKQEYGGGKGAAIKQAFEKIDSEIYVTVDGDNTYPVEQLEQLIQPIEEQNASQVIGCRKYLESGSMDTVNYIGNIVFSFLASKLHRNESVEDILSGYRAITKDKVEDIEIKSSGFDIETELTMLSMANGGITNIPMNYYERAGTTKLQPFKDGIFVLGRMVEVRVRTLGYSSS